MYVHQPNRLRTPSRVHQRNQAQPPEQARTNIYVYVHICFLDAYGLIGVDRPDQRQRGGVHRRDAVKDEFQV